MERFKILHDVPQVPEEICTNHFDVSCAGDLFAMDAKDELMLAIAARRWSSVCRTECPKRDKCKECPHHK